MERSTIPKPKDRAEWLEARRPYFNASAASVLFDRHPFLTRGRYARVKLTGEEQVQTEAMRRGIYLEDALAAWWAARNEATVTEATELYVCGRVMATIDRWGHLPGVGFLPIEFKTTHLFTGNEPEEHWYDQCQAIMLCTGATEMRLVWMDARLMLYERIILADEAWQLAIAEGAALWMSFIDIGMVPEGVELSYEDAGLVYPVAEVAKVELDAETVTAIKGFAEAREMRLEWAKREDAMKGAIATFLGSAEQGVWEGQPVVEWRSVKPRSMFNTKRFADEHPDIYAAYLEDRPQRRMRLLLEEEDET